MPTTYSIESQLALFRDRLMLINEIEAVRKRADDAEKYARRWDKNARVFGFLALNAFTLNGVAVLFLPILALTVTLTVVFAAIALVSLLKFEANVSARKTALQDLSHLEDLQASMPAVAEKAEVRVTSVPVYDTPRLTAENPSRLFSHPEQVTHDVGDDNPYRLLLNRW